jgi:hypothetical protein
VPCAAPAHRGVETMAMKALLVCGIFASVLYVVADALGAAA